MQSKMATILEMLMDGEWHGLEEVQREARMGQVQVKKIVEFLREYGFVMIDAEKGNVKIERAAQAFLTQTATS